MWSYRLASENLQEFCGISLSYTLLGTLAEGETEFYADGTFVHIRCEYGQSQWNALWKNTY